ncbi:MAG TPA: hypothetical protein VID29_02570 [Solirubrobacteraceae bacterium]|jgi:hypothetical protein
MPLAPTAIRRLAVVAILALILLGALLRAGAIGANKRVSTDEAGYAADANHLLADRPYASFKWAPGTPVAFAVATALSGHSSLRVNAHAHGPAQYTQLAIETATLALIALAAWTLAGAGAAILGVALAATYVPLVLITRTYLSEPLGGLMFLAAVFVAAWARRRGLRAIALAGVLAGLTCLARNDLAVGMAAIAVALALADRPGRRVAALRAGVFLGCLVVTLTPWLLYAASREGHFVPVTTSGPDALFIGTYLPGRGEQFPTVESFAPAVCRERPAECHSYRAGETGPMFRLIASRYPGLSESAAATRATWRNIEKYAFGQPLAFAGMLWEKFWHMWSYPWSGGNSGLHPDTSRPQHLIYVALAWLGLLAGALVTRRWALLTAAGALLAVSALNTWFVAQARDNVRFMPLLFAYGAAGLWLLGGRLWRSRSRRRERSAAIPART